MPHCPNVSCYRMASLLRITQYAAQMKINVQQVLARDEAKKHEVAPLPKVILRKEFPAIRKEEPVIRKTSSVIEPVRKENPAIRKNGDDYNYAVVDEALLINNEALLRPLWEEMSAIKTQRGILSTRTAYLVTEIANKMLQESPARAADFMAGEIPSPELKEHYDKIQSLTDQATAVWDKIQYVEQYGKLPGEPEAPALEVNEQEVSALIYEIRRLDDRIHKTSKKLKGVKPKNPSRLAMWNQKLALDEASRIELKRKLKALQYGARAQRTGEE